MQALAQLIACEVHPLNNLRVLSYLRRELKLDEAAVSQVVFALGRRSVRPARDDSSARWSGGRYCFGDSLTIADVCLVPQMYNARRFACDLAPYPTLVRIAAGLDAEPAFARAAPDRQPDATIRASRVSAAPCSMRTSSSAWRPPATAVERRVDRARQLGGIVDAPRPRVGRFGDLRELR